MMMLCVVYVPNLFLLVPTLLGGGRDLTICLSTIDLLMLCLYAMLLTIVAGDVM